MNLRRFLYLLRGPVRVVDTTPDAFSFTTQTGVALDTVVVSDWITVSGIEAPADISVIGGEYEIEGSSPTSLPGTVENGQRVRVHHTSAASYAGETITTLIIGGVSAEFHSVTGADPAGAWASPTASISFGKLTRVGYGGRDEIGYQGAGAVTISGTNSSHWQWVTNCVVPKNGSQASGTAWVASPSDTYTLTLTDTATGETCTLTVTTDASAADVSSYAQMQGTLNAIGFGTTIYVAAGFHERGSADLRIFGSGAFDGSNWKHVTVRGAPYSATIANQRFAATSASYGVKYTNLILEDRDLDTSGTATTGAIVPIAGTGNKDIWIEDCKFVGTTRKAAGKEPRGLNGPCRNVTLKNCVGIDTSYILGGGVLGQNLLVDGLIASGFSNDVVQVQFDDTCTNCNATIQNLFVRDVDVPAGSQAHADFIQVITGGSAGLTLTGTVLIQKCGYALGTGLFECNFLFGNNGSATNPVRLDNVTIKNLLSIGTTANNPNISSRVNNLTIDRILSSRDINNPNSTMDSNINVTSSVLNATVTNCIGNTITLNNTGTTTQSNNLPGKNTAASQTAIFADPYVATGGTSLHGDWSTADLMLADLSARYKTIGGVTAGPFDSAGAWAV